jgi:hypothetical protein
MNNVSKLVKQYNRFVEDLGSLNSVIYELLTDEFKLTFAKEYWSPRDRSAWSSKEYYCGWYTTNKIVLYVCFNLITDIPYLQFMKCDVNLKESKPEEFGIRDGFDHIENDNIEKIKISDCFMSFEQDWGKCYYCKIDLTTIDSDETVNRDIKKVLGCMLNNKYSITEFNKLKFL